MRPSVGWYASLRPRERERVRRYLPEINPKHVAWPVIRETWRSAARLAVAPLQDVLGLGSDARMNTPGTPSGNWRWRAPGRLDGGHWLHQLADLTRLYGRS